MMFSLDFGSPSDDAFNLQLLFLSLFLVASSSSFLINLSSEESESNEKSIGAGKIGLSGGT